MAVTVPTRRNGAGRPDSPGSRRADAGAMAEEPRYLRHHWVNALVGVLDGAFYLTQEEQYFAAASLTRMFDTIGLAGLGDPQEVPAALVLEKEGGFYSQQMASGRNGPLRPVRASAAGDIGVPLEDWRDALCRMLFRAYPDLAPAARLYVTATFDELLAALGLPDRASSHLPSDVVSAYREARS